MTANRQQELMLGRRDPGGTRLFLAPAQEAPQPRTQSEQLLEVCVGQFDGRKIRRLEAGRQKRSGNLSFLEIQLADRDLIRIFGTLILARFIQPCRRVAGRPRSAHASGEH